MRLMPDAPVPALEVPTVAGAPFRLGANPPQRFTMLVFYRGLHCPICRRYLTELDRLMPEFEKRGVAALALSTDDAERARQAAESWGLKKLPVAFGLGVDRAREWGLYVSTGRGTTSAGVEEPALFNEPGLFLIRPDGRLYWGTISTMPFGRPHFDEILQAVDFVIAKDYPARGAA